MRKLAAYLILLIFAVQLASAIGISPAKNELNLDLDNPIGEGTIRVLNNERKDMHVLIEVQGELKDYLQFDKKDFVIGKEAGEGAVHYSLDISKIPPAIRRSMKMSIYVIEVPQSLSFSGSGAVAGTAAIYKLILNIPESISAKPSSSTQPVQQEASSPSGTSTEGSPDYVPLQEETSYDDQELSGQISLKEGKGLNMAVVYIVIALAAINLIWVLYLFRRKRNP